MRPGACEGPGDGDCTPAWVSSAHELWGSQADAVPLLHLGPGCLPEGRSRKGPRPPGAWVQLPGCRLSRGGWIQ